MTRPSPRTFAAISVALAALFVVGSATARGGLRDLLTGAEIIEDEADDRLDALDRELNGMKHAMRELPRGERRAMRHRIDRMDALIDELRDDTDALARIVEETAVYARRGGDRDRGHRGRADVGHHRGPTHVEVVHHRAPAHTACTANDFRNVQAQMEGEWFDSGKMEVLTAAVGSRYFTVAQVKALVGQFSFDSYQVDAAAMLHARTVDLENWYQVEGVLTFSSSKRELRRRVGV